MPEIKQSMQSLLSNCNFGALTFFLSAPPLLAGALKWCQPTFHLDSLSTTEDIGTVFICHYYLLIRINPLTVLVYVLFGFYWNSEERVYLLYAFKFFTPFCPARRCVGRPSDYAEISTVRWSRCWSRPAICIMQTVWRIIIPPYIDHKMDAGPTIKHSQHSFIVICCIVGGGLDWGGLDWGGLELSPDI